MKIIFLDLKKNEHVKFLNLYAEKSKAKVAVDETLETRIWF